MIGISNPERVVNVIRSRADLPSCTADDIVETLVTGITKSSCSTILSRLSINSYVSRVRPSILSKSVGAGTRTSSWRMSDEQYTVFITAQRGRKTYLLQPDEGPAPQKVNAFNPALRTITNKLQFLSRVRGSNTMFSDSPVLDTIIEDYQRMIQSKGED